MLNHEIKDNIEKNFQEKYHTNFSIIKASPLGGGCINSAYKITTNQGEFFLKTNSNDATDLFIREAESLNEFSKSNNQFVVFPIPYLATEIDDTPGYLLTSYLEPGKNKNDEEKLGAGIAMLHKVSSENFGFLNDNYCGATLQDNSLKVNWVEFFIENRLMYIVSLIKQSRSWTPQDELLFDKFCEKVGMLIQTDEQPALVHGDLWSGNFMYTSNGPALIDPAACYCNREYEMGIMTMFGGFSQRVYDAYNEVWKLPYDWETRNEIYQLYHVLNHYFLFGGFYKNQALSLIKKYI